MRRRDPQSLTASAWPELSRGRFGRGTCDCCFHIIPVRRRTGKATSAQQRCTARNAGAGRHRSSRGHETSGKPVQEAHARCPPTPRPACPSSQAWQFLAFRRVCLRMVSGCAQARARTASHATRRRLTPVRVLRPAGARRCALQQQVWVAQPLWRFMARCSRAWRRCRSRSGQGLGVAVSSHAQWCAAAARSRVVPRGADVVAWLLCQGGGEQGSEMGDFGARDATQQEVEFNFQDRVRARDQPPCVAWLGGSWIAATAPGSLQQRHGAHPHDPVQGSGPDLTRGQNVRSPFAAPICTLLTFYLCSSVARRSRQARSRFCIKTRSCFASRCAPSASQRSAQRLTKPCTGA